MALQVSDGLDAPVTVAENCCVAPTESVALAGVTVMTTGRTTVNVVEPLIVGLAFDLAVTVTVRGEDTFAAAGAVYSPEVLMDPEPEMLHVTAVFVVPVTVAVICCFVPAVTCAFCGEIDTATPPDWPACVKVMDTDAVDEVLA
jgi:hypothetical protein